MNSIHVQIWRLKVSNIQVSGTRLPLNHSFWQARVLCLTAAPAPAPQTLLWLWSRLACVPQFLFSQKASLV